MCLDPNDSVSRCIIFDKAFVDGVHTNQNLFVFGQSKDDNASHESGILRSLAPTDQDVHDIGCGIAALQNSFHNIEGQDPKRRYYCGFRTALLGDILLVDEEYKVLVELKPEGNIISHVDIALFVTVQGKSARNNAKTDAGLTLAHYFGLPQQYICPCDESDQMHPLLQDPQCLTRGLPDFQVG